jgi:hypothetical protein
MAVTTQHPKVKELLDFLQQHFEVHPNTVKVVVTLEVGEAVKIEQTYHPSPK